MAATVPSASHDGRYEATVELSATAARHRDIFKPLRSSPSLSPRQGSLSGMTTATPRAVTPQLIVGERERRLYVLAPENIEYIESQGNYVKLHDGDGDYISRDSIKRLTATLAGRGFVRIERSLLLNVRAIVYAQRAGRGTYRFTLQSGVSLRSGARYRSGILRAIPFAQDRSVVEKG